jgi:hypothetical protein
LNCSLETEACLVLIMLDLYLGWLFIVVVDGWLILLLLYRTGYEYVGGLQRLPLLMCLHHLPLVELFSFFQFDLSDFDVFVIDNLFLISLLLGLFYVEGLAEVSALDHRIVLHVR